MALNYNALTALTRNKWLLELEDDFFNSHPFLVYLRERWKPFDGVKIIQPLNYAGLTGVKSYRGYDTVTRDQNIPITAAEYSWKHLVAPVCIAETEFIENAGEEQVRSIVKSKVEIAMKTLAATFATQLYGDGTGNSNKDIDGLGIAVAATGTYGGIDRATDGDPWWKAVVHANGGQARPLTTLLMRKAYLACSDNAKAEQPDIIFTTQPIWNRYAEMTESRRVIPTKGIEKLASLGFQALDFMGVPLVWDRDCPAGCMYFLNTRYMGFKYSPMAKFTTTPWRRVTGNSYIGQECDILLSGNLVLSNCRRHALLKDIDETGY